MTISLIFNIFYFLIYTTYNIQTIRRLWSEMLGPTIAIMISFISLIVIDTINIIIMFILLHAGVVDKDFAYKETLVMKLLVRRISIILLFKVLFTLKRVELQLNQSRF